jgi:hypothetical protein
MQLKYVPYCFVILAAVCLAGAVTASTRSAAQAEQTAQILARQG